jgi:hypothetical protein
MQLQVESRLYRFIDPNLVVLNCPFDCFDEFHVRVVMLQKGQNIIQSRSKLHSILGLLNIA